MYTLDTCMAMQRGRAHTRTYLKLQWLMYTYTLMCGWTLTSLHGYAEVAVGVVLAKGSDISCNG